ncbi:MAG TPA: TIGR03013 family XrtA/PEP-CTERM system glycosyltransferase, partial [Longimicrobiales bacterium]|nr:TIGR03013 family XrtA/PEP-CTERM system glycosyltransferase [Longimicrobiales bacterium]
SRTLLAVEARKLGEALPPRIVSMRVFNGHVHRVGLLALVEASVVVLAVFCAIYFRFIGHSSTFAAFENSVGPIWPRALLVAGVFVTSLFALGLYQLSQRTSFNGVLVRLTLAILLAEAALAIIYYLAPSIFVGRGVTGLTGGFALLGLTATRYLFMRLVDEEIFKRRVLVWGAGSRAASIARRLRRRTDQRGFRIVSYVRTPSDAEGALDAQPLGRPADVVPFALRQRVEEIVVAMDDRRAGFPMAELMECRLRGIQVSDIVSFLERESGRVSVELMHPSWLIFSNGFRSDFLRLATKRGFDVAVSLVMLIATLPVSFLTALAIWLEDRGPIFYRQVRTGQNGRPFSVLKFRSMRPDAEPDGTALWAAANDPRITRVGAIIRRARIDELPQLYNVLVGHMSFVGPRPERPQFVEQLTQAIPFYPARHSVKPGITGWAQVRYGYGASTRDARDKLEYDLYYVKHHSLAFDLMVLLQTVEIVLFRIGAR